MSTRIMKASTWFCVSMIAAFAAFSHEELALSGFKKSPDKNQTNLPLPPNNPPFVAGPVPSVEAGRSWVFYADGSFLYWQPSQDNMELGAVCSVPVGTGVTSNTASINGKWIEMDFDFTPGFKVGLGGYLPHGRWDIDGTYTWFRSKNNKNVNFAGGSAATQFISPNQGFNQSGFLGQNTTFPALVNAASAANAVWHLNMDLFDLDLGRWFSFGDKLTLRPNFGARGALIRQRWVVDYVYIQNLFPSAGSTLAGDIASSTQIAQSWGVGARCGLDTNWMIGRYFRLYGDAEADILYTRYTKISQRQTHTGTPVGGSGNDGFTSQEKNVNALKTHLDLELGFGVGGALGCQQRCYLDFSAGYTFQAFFGQNVFRRYISSSSRYQSINPIGDLYIQGLNAELALTF